MRKIRLVCFFLFGVFLGMVALPYTLNLIFDYGYKTEIQKEINKLDNDIMILENNLKQIEEYEIQGVGSGISKFYSMHEIIKVIQRLKARKKLLKEKIS